MRKSLLTFGRALFKMLVGVSVLSMSASVGAAETTFFNNLPDVPLIEGFHEPPNSALSFDKPAGRIVDAEAVGPGDPSAVLQFYGLVLRELGWISDDSGDYLRDGERLSLEITEHLEGDLLTIRIYVRPQ